MQVHSRSRCVTGMSFRPMVSLVLAVLVFSLLAGCAETPVKVYPGSDLPKERTAVIRNSMFEHFYVVAGYEIRIELIDGLRVKGHRTFDILPGPHSVSFSYLYSSQYYGISYPGHLEFNAEAGHVYNLHGDHRAKLFAVPHEFSFWIVDETTGKIVAGAKPD